MRVLLISANRDHDPTPVVPIGILAVAATLRPDHEVHVLDLCFEDDVDAAIAKAVREIEPQVVGLGLRNLHSNSYNAVDAETILQGYERMAKRIREVTTCPLILGGAGFSLQPTRIMARLGADHGVVGEGERAFRQMVDTLARGETPPQLLRGGAVTYDKEGIVPVRLKRSAEIQSDLDLLPPPARDLVDPRHYARHGTESIQTKRGCAFGCTYCDYPDLEGRKVRVRHPATIADEFLERSRVPGLRFAFVVDSVFNVPPKHAAAVCDELIARGSPLPWACYGTPAAFDDVLVEKMVRAGCKGVEVGADSGTDRMLKLLKKPFAVADIVRTRELFVKHGLLDALTFVLGAEDETADEVRRTLEFVDKLNPDVAVFVVFTEERESMQLAKAKHRDAILEVLQEVAPKRSGWVVPELGVRFGGKGPPSKAAGPRWLEYAKQRRGKLSLGGNVHV